MNRYSLTIENITHQNNIFDFEYPFYKEEYRKSFEKKFINKYMFREIGLPTPFQFVHFFKTTLNEIMPYYVELYKTTLYEYDPIMNYDLSEEITSIGGGSSEQFNSNVNTDNSLVKNSDTPNGESNLNNPKNVSDMSASTTDNESTSTSNGTQKSTNSQTRKTSGNIGVQTTQDMIQKQRDIIINIDEMILNHIEIKSLFMGVY